MPQFAITIIVALLIGSAGCAGPATSAPDRSAGTATASPLSWMAGCWATADGNNVERWTVAAETYLFGHSVGFRNGAPVFFEQLRIEIVGDIATLFAYPMGNTPVPFRQSARDGERVVFENAAHDYPQRIVYRRDGETLIAEVSSLDELRRSRWSYGRCQ